MIYKSIGRRRKENISAIGHGAMGIGGYLDADLSRDDFYIDKLKYYIDSGGNLFDTAECYGKGHSETLIGRAIKGKRDSMFISTKVSPEHLAYNDVMSSVEGSLKRLGTDYIDLYFIHWPNSKIKIVDTLTAMKKLKDQGKIRYIGVSNFSFRELKNAVSYDKLARIDAVQLEYNLFERRIEDKILPYCETNDILTMAYSPLDQGKLCNRDILKSVADKYAFTEAQVILSWLISHNNVVAIPSSKNKYHIRQNIESMTKILTHSDFYKISKLYKREKIYVDPKKIKVEHGGRGDRKTYSTIEEAIENKLGMTPSPVELSEVIREEKEANPVKIVPIDDENGVYDYKLVEGRLRYWAWVIAFDWEEPILVNIVKE